MLAPTYTTIPPKQRVAIAAIDCGTSAMKAGLFDLKGTLIASSSSLTPCEYSPDGRISQAPQKLLKAAFSCIKRALRAADVSPKHVASLCITNQRATVLCVDHDGVPLSPAINWQDMRSIAEMEKFRQIVPDEKYYGITGLPINPVFTLGKLLHLRNTDPQLFCRTPRFALIQDFLLHGFGCREPITDQANASLTGLMDIHSLRWSNLLLEAAGLKETQLPIPGISGQVVGAVSREAARNCGLLAGTPLILGAGDQQCAGVGAGIVKPGLCSITIGTAGVCFVFSEKPVFDPARRVSCCVHGMAGAWEVEGLQNAAGDSLRWAARRLTGISSMSAAVQARIATVPPGANGAFFAPYLAGAAAPMWIPQATGVFFGLRQMHDSAAMARAVLEGVAYESRRILDVLAELQIPVKEIRLTGGFSNIAVWNRIQASVYGRSIQTLQTSECSLLGAAILGAVGVGIFPSVQSAVDSMVHEEVTFNPHPEDTGKYQKMYRTYVEAVETLRQSAFFENLRINTSQVGNKHE
ncbi:MAG: FGGY family carbohydrate kinase [Candidatus Ozemobacteraceae bacterium]